MQVFIALLWIFLVLVALILPVLMLIWLWGRIRLLLDQIGTSLDKLGYTARKAEGKYHRPFRLRHCGVQATVKDIAAAKAIRNQIKERRYTAKQYRLATAKTRWKELELV